MAEGNDAWIGVPLPLTPGLLKLSASTHVTIFVPFYNAGPLIDECLRSVHAQTHERMDVIAIDDASTDGAPERLLHWAGKFSSRNVQFEVLRQTERGGPAHSKWLATSTVAARSLCPLHLFFILDGDDALTRPDAVARVCYEFARSACCFTYGSFKGPYCDQARAIDSNDIREMCKKTFPFAHPRCFSAQLLRYFAATDFQMNGDWLQKCTDRPFIFKCIEMVGVDRVRYIRDVLYKYTIHRGNSTLDLPPDVIQQSKDYFSTTGAFPERRDYRGRSTSSCAFGRGRPWSGRC